MLTTYANYPQRGGNLVHRYKTIDNFPESVKYIAYPPKCAIIVVFDFTWGDCIKRRKKLETMVMKNLVGGRGKGVKKVHNYGLAENGE